MTASSRARKRAHRPKSPVVRVYKLLSNDGVVLISAGDLQQAKELFLKEYGYWPKQGEN